MGQFLPFCAQQLARHSPGLHRSPSLSEAFAGKFTLLQATLISAGISDRTDGRFAWGKAGGEGRRWVQGEGRVAAVFALHPQHLPRVPPRPFKSKHRETPANLRCRQAAGKEKEAAQGHGLGCALISPPFSQKSTPRPHAALPGPGMTLRSTSPLVNISLYLPNFNGVTHAAFIAMAGSHYISLYIIFPPAFRAGKVQRPGQRLKGW